MRIGSPKTLCSSVASVRKCSGGHCFAGPKIAPGVKTKKDSGREISKEPSYFYTHSRVISSRGGYFSVESPGANKFRYSLSKCCERGVGSGFFAKLSRKLLNCPE